MVALSGASNKNQKSFLFVIFICESALKEKIYIKNINIVNINNINININMGKNVD